MALSKDKAEFLARVIPIAQRQAKAHGNKLFASVTIAQAMHESGWGTSKKMIAANALYGVKVGASAYKFGTAWKGAAYKTGTTEYYDGKTATKITDWFRQYDSIEDATCDYMDMLCTCKRYKAALNCSTPEQSIKAIVASGYATGPNYATQIMKIINTYNLTQYDGKVDSKVNPYPATAKVLRRGSKGDAVRYLQWILKNKAGFTSLSVDGSFGPATEKAVMSLQEAYKITVDGVVGKNTWSVLKNIK